MSDSIKRVLRPILPATLLLAAALGAPGVAAQTAKEESVLYRVPKLGPTGVQLGSLIAYPRLSVDAEYDDNIFRTKHDRKDDVAVHVRPGVTIATDDWHPVNFTVSVGADLVRYLQYENQKFDGFDSSGRMLLDIADDASFETGFQVLRAKLKRGLETDIGEASGKDLAYWMYEWSSSFKYEGEPIVFRLSPLYRRYDYERTFGSDIDREDYRLDARVGVVVGPHTTVFVDPGYTWVRYDDNIDTSGFKRNSEGYDVRVGVAYDASASFYFEAGAGYFRRNFQDSRLKSLSGVSALVRGYWNPTELLSFMLEASRGATDTYISSATGTTRAITSTGVKLRAAWEASDYLIVDGGIVWNRLDIRSEDRSDDFYVFDIGAKYYLSRYLYLGLRYSHEWRNSDVNSLDYRDNRVLFSISTQL